MKLLKLVLGLAIILILGGGLILFGARFADGPLEMIPGGPLVAGDLRPTPDDWTFAANIEEIEFESGGRSRTSWIVVDGVDAFIPASALFPPMKRWHKEALTDPAAVVRIEGIRYPVSLERLPPESSKFAEVLENLAEKYPPLPGSEGVDLAEAVWLFQLHARSS